MTGLDFGSYRFQAPLTHGASRGAMGEVWRAFDTATDRDVALRLLPLDLSADAMFARRFRHEARIVMALQNPHVIPVHRYGEFKGRLFLDMQLIAGRDLGAVLAEGPMDPVRAVRIIGQVADGLQAAHAAGLIHRDVRPSNVLLDDADVPVVIDFGLSGGEPGPFAAPELAKGDVAEVRSDIYSLACLLEQCLTGVGGAAVRDRIPELDAVIAAGRAEHPDDRPSSAMAFAEAAHQALAAAGLVSPNDPLDAAVPWPDDAPEQRPLPARPRRRWSREKKILVATLASLGILAMIGTTAAALLMPFLQSSLMGDGAQRTAAAPPTTTAPAVYIAPLAVRPVVRALVPQPGQCDPIPPGAPVPPPPVAPADGPLGTCDVERKAFYELGPVALTLTLTGANAVKLPMQEFSAVQLVMDTESGERFGAFTATQMGKQVAFVRDGVVLAAPGIAEPLKGDSLQLSGELSAETAETIAKMLRSGT